MRKLLKWIMIAIAVILIAGAALAAYVANRVEPENLKKELAAIVLEQTGRTLTISGDLSLKFFPWLGATIHDVSLSNAEGFGPEPMFEAGKVIVEVQVMPLLSKQIQMGDVVLHNAAFRFMQDASGRSNLDDLLDGDGKKKAEGKKTQEAENGVSYSFSAESLEIESLDIFVDNRQDGRSYSLKNASLQAAPVALATPMKCSMDFGFGMTEPQMNLKARLETVATVDPENDTYLLRKITGVADVTGEVLKGGQGTLRMDMDSIAIKTEPQAVNGKDMVIVADVSGEMLEGGQGRLHMNMGSIAITTEPQVINTKDMVLTATVMMDSLPGGELQADLNAADATLNLDKQGLKLPEFILTAYGATISGSAEAGNLFGKVNGTGALKLAEFSPAATLKKMGGKLPEMQDPAALTSASGELELTYRDNSLNVEPFVLKLDGQNLAGKLTVSNFDNPAILCRAELDSFDLDRYLPPRDKAKEAEKEAESPKPEGEAGQADEELIPVETLRELNLDAMASADHLKLKGIQLADVKVHVQAKDGRVVVKPFSFKGYDGAITTAAIVDVAGNTPHSGVAVHVNGLNAGPLAKDFAGRDDIAGNVDLHLVADGHGNSVPAILGTLGGNFKIDLQDGVFPGVDLAGLAQKTKSEKDKGGTIEADSKGKTKFGSITGSGVIDKGVVTNKDLSLMAPNLRAIGDGTVNLVSQKLNYTVLAKLVASSKGQGGLSYNELTGIAIPVHLGGTLSDPSWYVDVTQYVKMLGGAVVGTVGDVLSGVGNILTLGGVGKKQEEQRKERRKALRVDDDPDSTIRELEARF